MTARAASAPRATPRRSVGSGVAAVALAGFLAGGLVRAGLDAAWEPGLAAFARAAA
jgi:hypothetical protein